MDTLWAVPRNDRPDPIRARIRSLLLLLVLGSAFIATTVLAAIGRASESFGIVGKAGIVVVSVLINAGVCLVVFRGRYGQGCDLPSSGTRCTGGGGHLATPAVVRRDLRSAGGQVVERDE
jgi:membrane protein